MDLRYVFYNTRHSFSFRIFLLHQLTTKTVLVMGLLKKIKTSRCKFQLHALLLFLSGRSRLNLRSWNSSSCRFPVGSILVQRLSSYTACVDSSTKTSAKERTLESSKTFSRSSENPRIRNGFPRPPKMSPHGYSIQHT
jgi:hypothetical protein